MVFLQKDKVILISTDIVEFYQLVEQLENHPDYVNQHLNEVLSNNIYNLGDVIGNNKLEGDNDRDLFL